MLSTILFIYCKQSWFHTFEYMSVISNSRMLQSLHMSHRKWHHSCNYLEQLQQSGSFHASRNVTHEWWTEGVLVPSAGGTWNVHKKYLCWNPSISSIGILTDGYKCGTKIRLYAHLWQLKNICWQLSSHSGFWSWIVIFW